MDCHQHYWRYNEAEYGWIDESMSPLRRDFLPCDLKRELSRSGLDKSVAVQARQTVTETQWLLELAGENDFIAGVVGWVDLTSPAVEDALAELSSNDRLKGVRHILQDEPDDEFMLREDFIRGIGKLGKFDLTYDILIFPRHIRPAVELAGRFPQQPFVLDHIAKPSIKDGLLEPWKNDIKQLAAIDNVYCKMSGMITEASWTGWEKQHFAAYMEAVLEMFGPERLMFGSDWPVCTVAASYEQVLEIVTDFISRLSEKEQTLIMGQNATEFYNLRQRQ